MIWCVEDDDAIREVQLYALESAGFQTRGFSRGDTVWQALATEMPELILLDVMLPGMDGVTLLKAIREDPRLCHIPVIMATAKGAEYDKIQTLDLGADDHLAKPFGLREMVSRVRAVLRRYQCQEEHRVLRRQGLELDLDRYTCTLDGHRLALTYKEFRLLSLLLSRPGVAFTRQQLFSAVWDDTFTGETRTVDMHIKTLRQKLGRWGEQIETVRNVGYRLSPDPDGSDEQG